MVAYTQVIYDHSMQTKSYQYQVYFFGEDGYIVVAASKI